MGVLVDCQGLGPKTQIGAKILDQFLIRKDDVVLIGKGRHSGNERSFLVKEGIEYLLEKRIKMVGVDDTIFPEDPQYAMKDLDKYFCHDLMLSNGIPIIEGLANLGELRNQRFLFFGFPAKMGGLESFPIRAVAIEVPAGI
jgi:kynurenine formamidase